jgi:predicted ABC-type ATPase
VTSLPVDRQIAVAICGPNGAGKSTFYEAFLASSGLRFVNTDEIARELDIGAYAAATMAARIRDELVSKGESFIFETVLSDPVGEKVSRMVEWQQRGYAVVLCFVGLANANISDTRVAMRVSQGGHDVPVEKLKGRFPRTLENLKRALSTLDHVLVYDNSDLRSPYRFLARFESGVVKQMKASLPAWFKRVLAGR